MIRELLTTINTTLRSAASRFLLVVLHINLKSPNSPLSTFNFPLSTRCRGFTLMELMVTLGIFLVMTGGVLSNYRGYGTNVLFANASEDVILSLRQAQIYGVGVKGSNSVYTIPYGVYFSTAINQKSKVVIFGDNDSNHIYDTGELLVETTSWNESISVSSLVCDGASCGANVWVTFKRPSSNAIIVNTANQETPFDELAVTISDSVTGKTSTVKVTSAGQISLQ